MGVHGAVIVAVVAVLGGVLVAVISMLGMLGMLGMLAVMRVAAHVLADVRGLFEVDAVARSHDLAAEPRGLDRAIEKRFEPEPVRDQHVGLGQREQVGGAGVEVVRRGSRRHEAVELDVSVAHLGYEVGKLRGGGHHAQLAGIDRRVAGGGRTGAQRERRSQGDGEARDQRGGSAIAAQTASLVDYVNWGVCHEKLSK